MKNRLQIITHKELCGILRISRCKGYELLKSGQIRASKVGSDYRILLKDVEEYMINNIIQEEDK